MRSSTLLKSSSQPFLEGKELRASVLSQKVVKPTERSNKPGRRIILKKAVKDVFLDLDLSQIDRSYDESFEADFTPTPRLKQFDSLPKVMVVKDTAPTAENIRFQQRMNSLVSLKPRVTQLEKLFTIGIPLKRAEIRAPETNEPKKVTITKKKVVRLKSPV